MTANLASRTTGLAIGGALGLAAAAYATASTTDTTVTAVGLDAYEGEIIEFGYADPRQAGGFEVLDLALIENGKATLRAPLAAPVDAEFVVVTDEGPRAPGIVEPGGSHELNADGAVMTFSGGNYQALVGGVEDDRQSQNGCATSTAITMTPWPGRWHCVVPGRTAPASGGRPRTPSRWRCSPNLTRRLATTSPST